MNQKTSRKNMQLLDGELKSLSSEGLVSFLVRNANECIQQGLLQSNAPQHFDEVTRVISHQLLEKYLSESNKQEFWAYINEASKNLKYRNIFVYPKNQSKPECIDVLEMEGFATPFEQVLYPFVCAAKDGHLENLKKCNNKSCSHFFIGRKNKLWCSDRCGSKARMQKKRKKDFIKKYNH